MKTAKRKREQFREVNNKSDAGIHQSHGDLPEAFSEPTMNIAMAHPHRPGPPAVAG